MLRVGTILRGIYRIDSYLSSGGFGNTYVATNIEFEETFAIKEFFMRGVTQREGNQTTVSVSNSENTNSFLEQKEKFKKEARRLRKLNNEHIVKVHDLFEENGTAYYVMDYVDGENLADKLKQTNLPIPEKDVWALLPQIIDALATVHKEGFCHLDIKPSNIMVDKMGHVKLIDFGASKQMGSDGLLTTNAPTAFAQTPGYAPPEQMEQNKEKIGPWTDFYALGATLYAVLTIKKPPLPSDINDDMSADKHLALPGLDLVSAQLRELVLRLLNTNWRQRPRSVEEIFSILNDSAAHNAKPITEHPGNSNKASGETTIIEPVKGKQPVNNKKASERQRASSDLIVDDDNKMLADYNVPKLIVSDTAVKSDSFELLDINDVKQNMPSTASGDDTIVDNPRSKEENQIITVNGVSFKMIHVDGGTFTMGATSEQGNDGYVDEKPSHRVTLSSYYIGETEVTQALWQAVMGSNPSYFKGNNHPVEEVSWDDCQTFIRKLNGITGKSFRLPTEAEWEFAARGGNKSNGYKYSGSSTVDRVAWYDGNSGGMTHDVKTKAANELGIYDMSGNVYEWCQDRYGSYSSSAETNPTGASSGSNRVSRGGCWLNNAKSCRLAFRYGRTPSCCSNGLSLRLVLP